MSEDQFVKVQFGMSLTEGMKFIWGLETGSYGERTVKMPERVAIELQRQVDAQVNPVSSKWKLGTVVKAGVQNYCVNREFVLTARETKPWYDGKCFMDYSQFINPIEVTP